MLLAGYWWSSITTSVRKVAEGVAKDIDELNESFQHMLTELDDPDPSTPQEQGASAEKSASADGSQSRQAVRDPGEGGASPPESATQREEILRRLEGEDTQLEAGLKVISTI
jgi:hypothetical protein